MRVVLVEKPLISRLLHDAYTKIGITEPTYFIATYGIPPFKPVRPKDLRWVDFPIIQTVRSVPYVGFNTLQPDKFTHCLAFGAAEMPDDAEQHITLESCRRLLNEADEVIFACDPDVRGVASFEQFIFEFLPDHQDAVFPAYFMMVSDPEHLEKIIRSPSATSHAVYQSLKNAALVKRYFEHNFMLNSQSVLNRTYQDVGGQGNQFISKYQIQLLYWLRDEPLDSRHRKIHELDYFLDRHWPGTGRYNKEGMKNLFGGVIGSPSSRRYIIKSLCDSGLVERIDGVHVLTSLGHDFLAALHPDCMDLDLPFRLCVWMDMPFDEARPKIDTYLRRYFSKQMRYMERA